MSKPKLNYFQKSDVLHLLVADGVEAGSIEITPNVTAELNEDGDLIGIEILNASRFLRDTVLDSVQAKMLNLASAG